MALPLAVCQEVHELEYKQFNTNDVSYLGLQFFIAGLHPDIQLDVIKSGTSDLYEVFKIAHACETAMQNKKNHSANDVAKVNELELDAVADPEEQEAVEAVRRQFAQKRMFSANNGSAYQPRTGNSSNSSNYRSGQNNGNANRSAQPQSGQRKPNPAFGKTCHYCKKKNHFQSDCFKRKRDNAPMVQVKEVGEDNCESVFM
jgi:hypothetical protein